MDRWKPQGNSHSWKPASLLIIISGPSGVGKGTLVSAYLRKYTQTFLSVSVTTRRPRYSERNGVHYHFATMEEFERLRAEGQLLECAEVFGDCYGSPQQPVKEALAGGKDAILEIDVQGGLQVKKVCDQAVAVFVLPPTLQELERRLVARHTENAGQISLRLGKVKTELQSLPQYDYFVINDRLDDAIRNLRNIVIAEKHRVCRLPAGEEGTIII